MISLTSSRGFITPRPLCNSNLPKGATIARRLGDGTRFIVYGFSMRGREAQQRTGEGIRLEGAQILGPFANADGPDRQAEALGQRLEHAAASRAVQFDLHQAVELDEGAGCFDLLKRFLADSGVQNQQAFMGRS